MTKRTYSRLISNRKQRIKIIDIRNSANFSIEWSMWFPVNVVFHVITYNPIYFINRALYLSCSNVSPAPTYRWYSQKKKKRWIVSSSITRDIYRSIDFYSCPSVLSMKISVPPIRAIRAWKLAMNGPFSNRETLVQSSRRY